MEKLKKFKIANPKQVLGGESAIVIEDEDTRYRPGPQCHRPCPRHSALIENL